MQNKFNKPKLKSIKKITELNAKSQMVGEKRRDNPLSTINIIETAL